MKVALESRVVQEMGASSQQACPKQMPRSPIPSARLISGKVCCVSGQCLLPFK